MKTKLLKIRDRGTRIDVLAIKMTADTEIEKYYLSRNGYPQDGNAVILMKLSDQRATVDLYDWHNLGAGLRTMQAAHDFIGKNFDALSDGDVIDVEFIRGETAQPKISERFTAVAR